MNPYAKLPRNFYLETDVIKIAKSLLGKVLCTQFDGKLTKARITETEAYCGRTDDTCHAYPDRRTPRTETMYAQGGTAYVYVCYGIHYLVNIVTNQKDIADVVLIRGVEPIEGQRFMLERRKLSKISSTLCASPATLSIALGITKNHDGIDLLGDQIWLENANEISPEKIQIGTRVGMNPNRKSAYLPWRFSIKNNKWVSKGKGLVKSNL